MSYPTIPSSYKRQQLLLEYAAIKSKCPEGIYLSPNPSDPATWAGTYFVRDGPYASAVLRFELRFPETYPQHGPELVMSTEMFHPLLVPLTTYTFAAGALDPNTSISSSEVQRLSPGSFNLRHEFTSWYSALVVQPGLPPAQDGSPRPRSGGSDGAMHGMYSLEDEFSGNGSQQLLPVLSYVKKAFEDQEFLDQLPLTAAVNPNAWHAWRAHRGLPKLGSRSMSPASVDSTRTPISPGKTPSDWNWEGVWESRVRNGIDESTNDIALFGGKNARVVKPIGAIRFTKLDDERTEEIQHHMMRALGIASS